MPLHSYLVSSSKVQVYVLMFLLFSKLLVCLFVRFTVKFVNN